MEHGLTLMKNVRKLPLPMNYRTSKRPAKNEKLREEPTPYRVNGNGAHHKPKFIDLFCGIGGFRLAFECAGCECVFSSDWNKYALTDHLWN